LAATIGGGGDGGAVGTETSLIALSSARSGKVCTNSNGIAANPASNMASLKQAAAMGNG
jgi:hypothetical protein